MLWKPIHPHILYRGLKHSRSRGILQYSHIQALLDPRVLATIQTIHSKPVVVLQLRGLVGTEISSARLCPQHSEALQALRGQKFGTWGLVV